jgi:hypothetical protein
MGKAWRPAETERSLFDLHGIIAAEGVGGARRLARTKGEIACVQAATAVLAVPATRRDRAFANVIVPSLPHKSLDRQGVTTWRHEGREATVTWTGGRRADGRPAGIPYGAKARLILLYLHSEVLRTGSPVASLGPTMHAWLRAMSGRPVGGMTYRLVAERLGRILSNRLSLTWNAGFAAPEAVTMADDLIAVPEDPGAAGSGGGGGEWVEGAPPLSIRLGDAFFRNLQSDAVAVRVSALRQISDNSLAIDLYVLLCRRLPRLDAPEEIPWSAIASRFGATYQVVRQMRQRYVEALRLALAVYPQAQVDITEDGLILHPSAPPLPHVDG